MRRFIFFISIALLFPFQSLASADACVQSCSARFGTNTGQLNNCTADCFEAEQREEKNQQKQQQLEYERQQSEEKYRQEELERERQRQEWDRQYFDKLLDRLSQPPQCPFNSRSMIAEEKTQSPGAQCICLEGYIPSKTSNNCVKEQQQLPAACPLHSTRAADGQCVCNTYYQLDPTLKSCVQIRSAQQSSKSVPKPIKATTPAKRTQPVLSRACKRDKDGICQCPAGYKPSSKTPFVVDGKTYFKSGRQVCAK